MDSFSAGGTAVDLSPYVSCGVKKIKTVTHYEQAIPPSPAIPPRPAIPPTLDEIVQGTNAGWTGGARSIASVGATESKAFRFKVPRATVGAFIGLNENEDVSTDPYESRYAFEFKRGEVRCWVDGEAVTEFVPYETGTYFFFILRPGTVKFAMSNSEQVPAV